MEGVTSSSTHMGFRFRKSLSILPGVRLNIGKKGLGISAGVKGARVGVGSKGAYTSVGIPGTGISSVNYVGKGKKQSQDAVTSQKPKGSALLGFLFLAAIVVAFIQPVVGLLLIFGLLLFGYIRNRKAKQIKVEAET